MTRRWLRHSIALAIVVGGVSLAIGAAGVFLVAEPPVIDVHLGLNMAGSVMGQLRNTGDTSASVTSIMPDGSCSALGVSATGGGAFTVPGMSGTHAVSIGCSSSSSYGIRRCQQHVLGPVGQTYVDFTGLCMTEGSSMYMAASNVIFSPTMVNTSSAPQTVMIFNQAGNPMSSSLSIQLGDQDGNFQILAPCLGPTLGCDAPVLVPPSSSFSVTVECRPQSMGLHSALLYVVSNAGTKLMPPVSLSCMGTSGGANPSISVNPGSVTLMHELGMGSASSTVHVTNLGGADLHISSLTLSGSPDWSYTTTAPCATIPCTVPASIGTFDITTTFTPNALFARDATLTITSDDPNNMILQIPLFGTGQGALLGLASSLGTPPTLDLGTSPIGVQTTASFDLRNGGNITLDPVSISIMQPGNEFAVSPNPTTVTPSANRTITVGCTPTAASLYTGTIVVTAPTAQSGSPISIDVRCTGTSGNLFATPSSVQLGEIRVGSPRVTRTIALKTAGPPLAITANPSLAMLVNGMAVTTPSSPMITSAVPSTFDLTVDPIADEDLANEIDVTAGTSLPIPVTGKIVTAKIDVPATLAVGSFCVGQPTTPAQVGLTATGTATIGLGAQPVMNRMSTSPFQLAYTSPVGYPYPLPPSQTASVSVIPLRQTMKGTQSDELVWTTDVLGQEAPHTTVSADFIADGGAIAPQFVDFGAVQLRVPGTPHVIKIQNCGTDPMTLSGPSIDPSGEFRDESATGLPQTLAPNQVATIEVNFVPKKTGLRIATLTVDSSKGTLGVMLTGQGLVDPHKTTETSFYACDCTTSDPSSGWPALVVIVMLRRRRRR